MSFVDYINANSPITNLPDLLNLHHSNPLGIDVIFQLVFIFVVVEVMEFINYKIRYRDKSNLYPALYSLLAVSLVAVYYYCFQGDLELHRLHSTIYSPDLSTMPADVSNAANAGNANSTMVKPTIGWFCYPEIVGWPMAIVNLLLLSHVVYSLLSACMQTAAQLSVEMGFTENKPWKEWKGAIVLLLVGALASVLATFIGDVAMSWTLVAYVAVMVLYVVGKTIADAVRSHNVWFSILIGLTFLVGIIACMMLSLECLRGAVFFIVVLAGLLANVKARKKKVEKGV